MGCIGRRGRWSYWLWPLVWAADTGGSVDDSFRTSNRREDCAEPADCVALQDRFVAVARQGAFLPHCGDAWPVRRYGQLLHPPISEGDKRRCLLASAAMKFAHSSET